MFHKILFYAMFGVFDSFREISVHQSLGNIYGKSIKHICFKLSELSYVIPPYDYFF